jgi:transcriptional regulator with XRE-family HTH domain
MFNKNLFSTRLSLLIRSHNITSKALADAIGVSKQAINQLEKEKAIPSTINLVAIADYFDVSIDYLVGRSNDPKRY